MAFQQRRFMHQAMGSVRDSVNSTVRHHISRSMFLSHGLSLTGIYRPHWETT